MKKVLLSILLALLCQVTANAQTPPCHNPNPHYGCIKEINGVTYIVFTVSCLDPGQTVAIWYMSTMGVSPMIVPCSTSVDPITFDPILYYCIDPSYPLPEGCVHYTWNQAWNGNTPPYPPNPTFEDQVCPCPSCNATFRYCVDYDPVLGTWGATFSLHESLQPGQFVELIVDGTPTYPTLWPVWLPFGGGSHKVCIKVWNQNASEYCESCLDICFPGQKSPRKEIAAVGGQSNMYFSEVKIYPNPASSSAKLEFGLSEEQQLTIELIDISGRVVSTIKDEKASAGYHAIDISTTDVPSGTYIVRMRTGKTIANYRLSVIK